MSGLGNPPTGHTELLIPPGHGPKAQHLGEQRKGGMSESKKIPPALSVSPRSRPSSPGTSTVKGACPRGVQPDTLPLVARYLLLIALEGNQEKRN